MKMEEKTIIEREKKIDLKFQHLITLILLVVVIILLFIVLFEFWFRGGKCVLNPTKYFIETLGEANDAYVSCSCMANKPGNPGMNFDSRGAIEIFNNFLQPNDMYNTNLSNVTIIKDVI